MAELQVADFPVRHAPNSRVTKDSETYELLAVTATFDGSATSAAWLPAVEIVSSAGHVVQRTTVNEAVAAGDSAEVTFAPFLGRGTGDTGEGGLQFGGSIQPAVTPPTYGPTNTGGYLHVIVTDVTPSIPGIGSQGFVFDDQSDFGSTVRTDTKFTFLGPASLAWDFFTGDARFRHGVRVDGGINSGGQKITNGADGTAPTDFATVEQLTAGTVEDITSTGGSITVSNPSGPTTNVDLPASGVTPDTYGDATHVAQVTVDAEGRVTAASDVAIASSGGIDFDTEPQAGDWLDIETTGTDAGGFGVAVEDSGGGGILLHSTSETQINGDGAAKVASGLTTLFVSPGFVQAFLEAGGTFQVLDTGNVPVLEATEDGKFAVFGVAPVAQQATPVTLGDVIAILQAFGYAA